MNPDIIKFFESHQHKLSNLIDKRPPKLSPAQVKAGAEAYYFKVLAENLTPKSITVAGGAYEMAWHVKYDEFLRDNEIIERHEPIIQALESQNKELLHQNTINEWLIWLLMFGIFILCSLYLGK